MKLNPIQVVISASIILLSNSGFAIAQTPGEILIVEALQDIALAIDELAPAQACKAESTTVSKGITTTAAHPNKDTADGNARKSITDKAWDEADANCKEMDKADGVTECRVKKGNLNRDKDIKVKCEKAGDVWACDAELVNDVTYICNT